MATYQFRPQTFGVKWAAQTAFDEMNGSPTWKAIACTMPQINFAREMEELAESRSADFEAVRRVIGSRDGGTFSFQMQLKGQPSSYDPTAAAPAETNETGLITDAFGSLYNPSLSALAIAGSGSDGNTWELSSGNLAVGAFYSTGTGAGFTVSSMGAVKTYSTTTQTLFEDAIAVPAPSDDVYFWQTFYGGAASVVQPSYKTFAINSDQDHDLYLIGCVLTGFKFMHSALSGPKLEFSYIFTDYEYGSTGGITAPTEYNRVPVLQGTNGARTFINGTSTGTADPTGTCGLGDLELAIEIPYAKTPCHAAAQGIATRQAIRRSAKLTFNKPWISDDVVSTRSRWQDYFEDNDTFSYSLQAGTAAGSCVQLLIPAMRVASDPGIGESEDKLVFNVEAEVAAYSGDGAGSGDPKNSTIRFGLG